MKVVPEARILETAQNASVETSAGGAALRSSGPRGGRTLLLVVLVAGLYLGYSPALDGEMQFDDVHSIAENPATLDLAHFAWLRFDYLLGASRPLVDLTFALNYRISGLAVRPYHLVNLAAHLAAVLAVLALALWILRRLSWPAPFTTALLTAALFGLHPLQSQAVAYICQRAEVLAALLYLLALLFALRAADRVRGPAAAGAYASAFLCLLLGWETKPTLATFPAALLLCGAAFPAAAGTGKRQILASLPFWAVTIVFSSRLLGSVSGTAHAGFDLPKLDAGLSAGDYLLTQSRVILTYLRLLLWPAGQNVDWDFAPSHSIFEPRTALALLAVAGILVAAAWLWRWSARAAPSDLRSLARLSAFGILWFFIALAPTSSVVPVGEVIEEHRVYLASFGIFLPAAAAGVLAARRFVKGPRSLLAAAVPALAVCVALGVALHRRSQVWESAIFLWSDAAAKSPHKARPHMNLGHALTPVDPARAVDEYRLALKLATDRTINRDELKQDLAGALLSLHRYREGIAILKELVATAPATPQLETNLAIAYLESGTLDEARATAERAAARFPQYAPAWHTLGQLAFARGDYAEAKRHFAQALALDPDSPVSRSSLAVTEERLGDRAAACSTWARYRRTAGAAAEAARERSAALHCEE
ncbi:MAG TPA: tetratricopeptide repeat protein [Myxococcales bacterium]|nr:tetratricopeptide repeat protein [Myxococcales bacterium]